MVRSQWGNGLNPQTEWLLSLPLYFQTAMQVRNYHPEENRLPEYVPDVKFRISYDIFGSQISNKTRIGFAVFDGVVKYPKKLG